MPKFNASVPHTLGRDKAKANIQTNLQRAKEMGLEQLKNMTEDWSKWDTDSQFLFTLATSGIKITGVMTVTDDQVTVNGEIPFAAMMFKGKIEQGFKDLVGKVLI